MTHKPQINLNNTKPTVIALHCSGRSGRMWQGLGERLGRRFRFVAPDLTGSGAAQTWLGEAPFTVSDEASAIIRQIDALAGPIHLVGHSYGGGVALRVARERPTRIASFSLYEPTAFHVLGTLGEDGRAALLQINAVARAVASGVMTGAYFPAARQFVDFWNGQGAWEKMSAEGRATVVRNLPVACLQYNAMLNERAPLTVYRRFNFSALVMSGEMSLAPAQLIARQLARAMKLGSWRTIQDAGHMGPLTHTDRVLAMICDHIESIQDSVAETHHSRVNHLRSAA